VFVVYFFRDSVRKLLDTPSHGYHELHGALMRYYTGQNTDFKHEEKYREQNETSFN